MSDYEDGISPDEQDERMRSHCSREGWELVKVVRELDVSGGLPLAKRPGMSEAVQWAETGLADVVMVAYFDRLVREIVVQTEIVSRVEGCGKRVMALDFGDVSHKTAAKWVTSTMMGVVNEYYRRAVGERTTASRARAIAEGRPPFSLPPGLRRVHGPGGKLAGIEPDPATAGIVARAFGMRRDGATYKQIRAWLRDRGVPLSLRGVQQMLTNRIYLGELRHGGFENLRSHEPIVSRPLFNAAQRTEPSRGRYSKSQRVLARLGVLRCGTCDGRMSVATNGAGHVTYACKSMDCDRHAVIAANRVEQYLMDETVRLLADVQGRASGAAKVKEAERRLAEAEENLDNIIETFSGMRREVKSAKRKLAEAEDVRDRAEEDLERLRRELGTDLTVSLPTDRDVLTFDEWRFFIPRAILKAVVTPGRGGFIGDRVRVVERFE